ncbi:MAG: hypothetical protein ACK5LX_16170 [Oscillospiraceae bacterium]
MQLFQTKGKNTAGACVAQVSFSEGEAFGAAWDRERRGIPMFSPRGISYRPCEGDSLLLQQVEGSDVCLGVLTRSEGMEPGELLLYSSGGAAVALRNDGSVRINGLTITREGQIIPPEKTE